MKFRDLSVGGIIKPYQIRLICFPCPEDLSRQYFGKARIKTRSWCNRGWFVEILDKKDHRAGAELVFFQDKEIK